MRIGLGWGVGSRAETKRLRVFLWEDEIWILLELADPLSPDPDASRQAVEASAASPPLSLVLSSTQRSWGMTAIALQASTPLGCYETLWRRSPTSITIHHVQP